MKKKNLFSAVLTVVLALAMCLSLAACGSSAAPAATEAPAAEAEVSAAPAADADKVFTVGICQFVKHEALDKATEGFMDALKAQLGDRVVFDVQNAAGDTAVCSTIVNSFVSKNVDLILANATPALAAAYNATSDIPILGTAVTEYGVALGIDGFTGTVGGNVSGTSDLAPLTEQADMILELVPDAKTVGLLYCSAEPNSVYQVQVVEEALTAKGIACTRYSFADSNDISAVTTKAVADNDALYIPTDNTAASCTETIGNIVLSAKTPVITGEAGICRGCGVATLSISYYSLGQTTGEMAAKILTGEADISTMPIEYDNSPVKLYNPTVCAELGIAAPEGYEALS